MIQSDWFILSYSAKWYKEDKIFYKDQRGKGRKSIENDKSLLKDIWKLFDEADVVVAHNGIKFDIPKINARFAKHGIKPPSPYRQVDTLQIARKTFAFTSNKLAFLCELLQVENKKLTHAMFPGFKLWEQCLKGNIQAWEEMEEYNKVDVLALEEVYDKLKVWSPSHPNHGVHIDDSHSCSKCGSKNLIKKGFKFTQVGKYQRYKCLDCGGYSRGRQSLLTTEHKKHLLTSE